MGCGFVITPFNTLLMNALIVNSSGRTEMSVSRKLVDELVAELAAKHPDLHTTHRDVATDLPFVNDPMIAGFYIPVEQRTPEQAQAVAFSDQLTQELIAADVLVIGAPIYNFTVPASLKAWVDLVCRAGLTFKASPAGYEGLLHGKKAYVVVTSGGVPVGSPYDLTSSYLRQVLGFIGITDVTIIGAGQLAMLGEQPVADALTAIKALHAA